MPSWKLLPASSERSILPPLLIKHDVQPTSYSVYVTDLTNIWSEISDRKTIIRRALRDDTVIDPSEGPDQLKLLLDHIRDALDCHDSTSLEISADSGVQDSQGNPGLQLRVTVNLPGGLNPLLWELSLKRAQQDVFSTEFVLPMLAALANFKIQTTSLINQIKQKDSVIDKLSAKLEEAKVNLSAVFPAAGSLKGSKSSNQERLFRAAPGLKAFDEKEWQDSVGSIANLSADGVAQNVLKGGLEASSFSQISQRKWWEDLDDPIELNATSKPEQSPIGSPSQQSESQEFQVGQPASRKAYLISNRDRLPHRKAVPRQSQILMA